MRWRSPDISTPYRRKSAQGRNDLCCVDYASWGGYEAIFSGHVRLVGNGVSWSQRYGCEAFRALIDGQAAERARSQAFGRPSVDRCTIGGQGGPDTCWWWRAGWVEGH